MKINELKINSYGKLKDKNIELADGINIIYGENEKGKSTLLNCIVNMLYGTSKKKNGKDISDYDKFKPWDTEEFSGKMSYTLDNNETYEIFREFGKKNPKVYNEDMEDISKDFSIDKSMGNQFFYEQTRVDETTFTSTVVSFQSSVELDNQTQNILLQKIANTSTTGEDSVSYKKAMDKLNKKQLDEIGTNRTQGKPINVVISEIERLTAIEESLKQYENYKYEIEDKIYAVENELQSIKDKGEFLNKLNNINQKEDLENQKLKYGEEKINEVENKIQKLASEKHEIQSNLRDTRKQPDEKVNKLPYIIAIVASIIICIILYAVTKKIFSVIPLVIAIVSVLMLVTKMKKVKLDNQNRQKEYVSALQYNKNLEKKICEINAQIELLDKNKREQVSEVETIRNETLKEISRRKGELKHNYSGKIDGDSIKRFLNSDKLQREMDQNLRAMNEKNMELHRLNLDKENIVPKLDELVENEEKLSNYKEEYEELIQKNEAINMTKEIIEQAYKKMKSDVTPGFTEKLSQNIADVTGNKYKKVVINESDGILVELPNGEYKNASLLSKGTIEQLYFAFRLSMIEDISEENMPIIFDEIFAYSDDKRLKEALLNINNNYSNRHQIILFTCTHREENALKELKMDHNLINL